LIQRLIEPANQKAEHLTGRNYISYSALSLYQQCPLRYYFKYIAGLSERTVSASLVFGSAIHRAVEHHFNELMAGNEPPCLDALLAEYDKAWQERNPAEVHFGKDDDLESLAQLATRMLTGFQSHEFSKSPGTIIGVEEELRGNIIPGCPDVLGRIDLLIETTEELVVTDLKTSKSRWSKNQAEDSGGQLLLYSELTRPLVPSKRIRLQFAVLTKTKAPAIDLHEVPVDQKRVDRVKRIVDRVWHGIEAEMFYPAPSPMNCPTCPFRSPCSKWPG
jgi:CRISPR/Cas system-associated exonuclease Cas4 (RecB family)